jgi:hypothetical protein
VTRQFQQFAVIDWSGQAVARPKGLALAQVGRGLDAPRLVPADAGWSRSAILDWLIAHADAGTDIVIGIDLSPAFPFVDCDAYFPGWNDSPVDAKALWSCVDQMAGADDHLGVSSFVGHPYPRRHFRQHRDCGDLFPGGQGRFRVCEVGQRQQGFSPYSCFNLVGAAQVGKSSLTGMRVLNRLNGRIPVWPFDPVPPSGPVIVEIYTSIAARAAGIPKGRSKMRSAAALDDALTRIGSRPHSPLRHYNDHATDAILTTAWLRTMADQPALWSPPTMHPKIAATEGWTFGVF